MTDDWGVDDRYEDVDRVERVVPGSTVARLRATIGRPTGGPPTVLVVRPGDAAVIGPAEVALEDGSEVSVGAGGALPPDIPLGYHVLRPASGGERRLVVSPGRCHLPPGWRAWGWAVQLYATRSRASQGIGDLADLARLTAWSADALGAGFVLVNPLCANAPVVPQEPSPYFPATRRFRNPIYLRVEGAEGAIALNGSRRIDRDAVWEQKRTVLEAAWAGGSRRAHHDGFDEWYARQPDALRRFATWCALVERHGPCWRDWPVALRRPDGPVVARAGDELADRVGFHAWLQWQLERQLAAAALPLPLVQDLPIGVDPDGFDAWDWQDLLAEGVTVGAPPDEFNREGQDWGLPPFVPWRLAAEGYQPFVDTIRASMATGGGLRIDHVMGLFRLWWVPEGVGPGEGAYVRYPAADLLDVVALESHRAGAVVVGEDLGTVEPGVRDELAARDILGYRVLWFEEGDPATWPAKAMGAVTTHDLPTVAGLWSGVDPSSADMAPIRERLVAAAGLRPDDGVEAAVAGAHRLLARSPCTLVAATLEDAVAEPTRPNVPGPGSADRPNWSLALPVPLEDLESSPLAHTLAAILRGTSDR